MVHLRAATTADAGEILTLQRAAWLSEGRDHDRFDLPPLTQTLDELTRQLGDHTVLVAVDGTRIVGTVCAHVDAGVWRIGRLGVVPDRAGEGLGTRLLAAVEALAPAGVRTAELFTGPNSTGNHAFYARRGYTRTETSAGPEFTAAAAAGLHLVAFAKELPAAAPAAASPTDPGPHRVDHAGVAVPDLEAAVTFWQKTFGARCVHRETNEEQQVQEAMLSFGDDGAQIQLLAPLSPESTIARFLDRNGPGLQQLALTVSDVAATSERLRAAGLRMVYDSDRRGTHGSRVNFVHPRDTGGVLVELVQPVHHDPDATRR